MSNFYSILYIPHKVICKNAEEHNALLNNTTNKLHRLDGPACEYGTYNKYSNGDKHWFKNGKRHREGGPAIDRIEDSHKRWFVDGKRVTFKQTDADKTIANFRNETRNDLLKF